MSCDYDTASNTFTIVISALQDVYLLLCLLLADGRQLRKVRLENIAACE